MGDEKVEYFISETNRQFDKMEERFDKMEEKLDQLISWRALLLGASLAVSAITSVILTVAFGR